MTVPSSADGDARPARTGRSVRGVVLRPRYYSVPDAAYAAGLSPESVRTACYRALERDVDFMTRRRRRGWMLRKELVVLEPGLWKLLRRAFHWPPSTWSGRRGGTPRTLRSRGLTSPDVVCPRCGFRRGEVRLPGPPPQ